MLSTAVLFGGPFTSPPALVVTLLLLLVVLVAGRVLLAITWRVLTIALGVVLGIWLLGVLGISL